MNRALLLMLWCCCRTVAGDWPQILGPERNGCTSESSLAPSWPAEGPRVLWTMNAGQGWSGPVISSNRLFLFHRLGDQEVLQCVASINGASLWKAEYPSGYRDDFGFDEGPRSTPATDGRTIITLGANGILNAWACASGSNVWRVDTRKQFNAGKGFFGVACSPLMESNRVLVNVGGPGAGIVAFNLQDGKVLWKATSHEASYSSPVTATFGGKRRALVLTRRALVALEPVSGMVIWEHEFEPSVAASVSAATPLVIGEKIFISASYGAAAQLLEYRDTGPRVIWNKDDALSNHYSTSVHHKGLLFGFDGRQEQRCHLRCVDATNGVVRWSEEHFGGGHLVIAGDKLLVLTERGELIMAPATAERFKPLARAQIVGSDCRAMPALANGLFFARDKRRLVCVDLR